VTYDSHSVEETQNIAADLARNLPPGSTLALHGQLGAGKTQFVRGLLIGLGGNPRTVSSPTYVLLNMYLTGRLPLYHLDAYRITTPADFEAVGFAELLEQGAIVAVEWPSKIEELLPKNTIQINFETIDQTTRRISIDDPK
jgi:tRNA threonylcarbamoyladenosine biosynthesis protein TsaE